MRLVVSLILEHIILGEFNSLLLFNETDSYPLSENEISDPPALVPVIDLKDAFIDVFCGDNVLNCFTI